VGYDAGKKTKGRQRHLFVDTLGLIHSLVVHRASIQDPAGGQLVLTPLLGKAERLHRIWVDGRYAGGLEAWALEAGGWRLEVVRRPSDAKGWVTLPKRWIVERTFAWLGKCRRLSKDYEATTRSSAAMVRLAMIHLMVRRLSPS
jgi:putative transposase